MASKFVWIWIKCPCGEYCNACHTISFPRTPFSCSGNDFINSSTRKQLWTYSDCSRRELFGFLSLFRCAAHLSAPGAPRIRATEKLFCHLPARIGSVQCRGGWWMPAHVPLSPRQEGYSRQNGVSQKYAATARDGVHCWKTEKA